MKFLQKLGKAIMLPVACLPLCGILMGLGYLLCPATMQGGESTGLVPMLGMFLVKAGGALIDNIAVLFAVGVGVGMADERDGTSALAALASWLMITTPSSPTTSNPSWTSSRLAKTSSSHLPKFRTPSSVSSPVSSAPGATTASKTPPSPSGSLSSAESAAQSSCQVSYPFWFPQS